MNQFDLNLIVQGGVAVIIVGVFYSLSTTTKMYGGIIGTAIRLFGLGTLFVALGVIERIVVDLHIVPNSINMVLAQNIFDLLGLVFLGLGFSKLASGTQV